MSDSGSGGGQLPQWISSSATILAPASVLGGLLFYFGYVSSRSLYEYFGVDVDTIGLSTRDYVMRSPQPLLVPLLVLTLLGGSLMVMHTAVRRRIVAAVPTRAGGVRRTARVVSIVGSVALAVGVILLFIHATTRALVVYNLVTPLLFSLGAGLVAYASRIRNLLGDKRGAAPEAAAGTGGRRTPESPTRATKPPLQRGAATILIYVVIAASVFWATATVAQWSGRGQAQNAARHLDRLPRIILDTKERLFLRDPGVEETVLPPSPGQTFHYRYRRLRLLIVGHDRMFLVPEVWSASNSTLVVPLDGSVRVQFQFQNQLP
jgi:hypothetical protein